MSGFGRILDDLNRARVRYVLIGGIALIRHGVVRATRDVDVIIAPEPENLERRGDLLPDTAGLPAGSDHDPTGNGRTRRTM